MAAGIKVSALDSSTNPESRMTFTNQAGTQEIGQALMDAVYDIAGGSGQWAIVSATSQATNQNAWIDAMKAIMESDSKYADLELVSIEYGDDLPEKSTTVTQALLTNYPDLKVICAPTTVGIAAAAKVLQDQNSSCKLTGLGLPSEMAAYIGDDDAHSCPYMFLWNPIDVGRLGAHVSMALVKGDITGAAGDKFTAGDMGDYEVVDAADGGTEVILGAPFKFDPSNIDEWLVLQCHEGKWCCNAMGRLVLQCHIKDFQQRGDFLKQLLVVPHAHGKVMGGRLCEPSVHIAVRIAAKPHMGLGVSDGHNGSGSGLSLGDNKFQSSVYSLGTAQGGNIAGTYLGLHGDSGALLAMVDPKAAKEGLPIGNGQMEGAVMAQKDGAAEIVGYYDLAEGAAGSRNIADLHGQACL